MIPFEFQSDLDFANCRSWRICEFCVNQCLRFVRFACESPKFGDVVMCSCWYICKAADLIWCAVLFCESIFLCILLESSLNLFRAGCFTPSTSTLTSTSTLHLKMSSLLRYSSHHSSTFHRKQLREKRTRDQTKFAARDQIRTSWPGNYRRCNHALVSQSVQIVSQVSYFVYGWQLTKGLWKKHFRDSALNIVPARQNIPIVLH